MGGLVRAPQVLLKGLVTELLIGFSRATVTIVVSTNSEKDSESDADTSRCESRERANDQLANRPAVLR